MAIDVNGHRIQLAGAYNMRDLGGYPTAGGGETQRGVFYRADSLHSLTEKDISLLRELGVTAQVDLRSVYETTSNPSRLSAENGFSYYAVTFLDNIHANAFNSLPDSLSEFYRSLLDNNGNKYAEVFRIFLSERGSCVFNCTAGKDRTGIVAMLLLKLAGVREDVVIADYSVSASNMESLLARQKQLLLQEGIRLPDYLFLSEPDDMRATLQYLQQRYSGAQGYLKFCGLDEKEIRCLKGRLGSTL